MSYSNYCGLMDGLCEIIGIPNSASLYERAELTVDGEDCVLMHGGEYNEDGIAIFCMFGEPPEDEADLIRQRLLEANLTLMQPGGMRFGINSPTDEVMLAGVVPMADLNPEGLLVMLAKFSSHARQWRQHYFLSSAMEPESCEEFSSMSSAARTRRLS